MKRAVLMTMVTAVALLTSAGCHGVQKGTNVQKGSALGAGAGTVLGAGVGHMSALGGAPGALVGLGLGAAAGAIAAEQLYGSADEAGATGGEDLEELNSQLGARNAQVAELRGALEREEAQKQALLEAHANMRKTLDGLQGQFGGEVAVVRESSGDIKLTILSEVLFASGKSALTEKGKTVLAGAAQTIREQFPDGVIEVRGHTDNVPIRYAKFASNWELSCARALSVVHYLIEAQTFRPDRLMAVGVADTKPVASNDTPAGRRMNRRAEIVIRPGAQLAARTDDLE